ncbi:MAG: LCP family protein [Candidatus Roizmanbacteria bacterium]
MHKTRLIAISLYIAVILCIMAVGAFVQVSSFLSHVHIRFSDLTAPLPQSSNSQGMYTFLIFGVGGGDHDGPNLTDTIMLAKYAPSTNTLTTVGLPRDLWDESIKDRINTIYTYALQQTEVDPYVYVKTNFQRITGLTIDHVFVVDFSTFEEVVDVLGGITITNQVGFVDSEYPIQGAENKECQPYDPNYSCRYETVSFPTGKLDLNGAVALKYVRSRHASGDEGTDFSRSGRQQEVIQGISAKIIERLKARDIGTLEKVATILDAHIKRTISNRDAIGIGKSMLMSRTSIRIVSNKIDSDYFEVPPMSEYEGKYVLLPPKNDFENFKTLLLKLLP